jgi:hypothetical protein
VLARSFTIIMHHYLLIVLIGFAFHYIRTTSLTHHHHERRLNFKQQLGGEELATPAGQPLVEWNLHVSTSIQSYRYYLFIKYRHFAWRLLHLSSQLQNWFERSCNMAGDSNDINNGINSTNSHQLNITSLIMLLYSNNILLTSLSSGD